jgi:hypothetical protein
VNALERATVGAMIDALGYTTKAQQAELRRAYRDDPAGFADLHATTIHRAERPAALLLSRVRAGDHRTSSSTGDVSRAAASWFANVAPHLTQRVFDEDLDRWIRDGLSTRIAEAYRLEFVACGYGS